MNIVVDNGTEMAVEGVARSARVVIQGHEAQIAVAARDIIAPARTGQPIKLDGAPFEVVKVTLRTHQLMKFTARRLADG